ncbi:MAG: PIN domain-containing protein [Archangiaceae bacterium]|nr:PIN domain-containing protein [Archangiaceae bacterium]
MNDDALICDTGALLDYLTRAAPDHRTFRKAIDAARTRYVPGLVLSELDYFLRDSRAAMRAFARDLATGAFTLVPVVMSSVTRAMEIDRRFADLDLGLVDASIVALAEELDVVRVATRDVADFSAVRLWDGRALELVVRPRRPER